MDCKQADLFFMRYAENKLEPRAAKNLARHLLVCENCRESFAAFDSCLDETPIIEAPADFTQNVMAQVRELGGVGFAWRQVAVGFAAIFVGVLLFAFLNFGYSGYFFGTLFELVQYYSLAITPFFESITASLGTSEHFSQLTFLFVPILSLLLFVLHTTEKKVEA